MTNANKPASEHVASCYRPLVDGVPASTMIEIRYDNIRRHGPAYVVAKVETGGGAALTHSWHASRTAAVAFAAGLGYTEVV